MMKKRILLAVSLLLALSVMSSCAYLPLLGLTYGDPVQNSDELVSLSGAAANSTADADGDTVTISREEYERYQELSGVLEMMDIVDLYFYEEVDRKDLIEGAMNGVLSGTGDPYTFYYNAEEYAEMWEDDEGEYAGVGMQISTSYLTGICTISRVFEGGPAAEAGIHKGDVLYKVEDMYVSSANINDAVDIMRGTPGTDVNVVMLRGEEEMEYVLTRATITVNRVSSTMLADGIGYIQLYEFAGDCATKFISAADALIEQGAKGLIIDLRDNPGGWLDDAEAIGDYFLDTGVLCYLEYNDGTREYYRTKPGKHDVELVILLNENSASASEVLSGALKDRADATIVGVQSYGKGIVQSLIPVGEAEGMQITVAQYFTPNGNAVHTIGLTPDVECELPDGDNGMYEFGDLADPQLARALEVMQEKLK